MPDYRYFERKMQPSVGYVQAGRPTPVRTPREARPRIIRPTADETLRIAAEALRASAKDKNTKKVFEPDMPAFRRVVKGAYGSSEAERNVYYHSAKILDPRKIPATVKDVTYETLPDSFAENWTAIDAYFPDPDPSDTRILTVSGLPAAKEFEAIGDTAKEIEYLLTQINTDDRNMGNIVKVLGYVVERNKQLDRLLHPKVSRPRWYLEDIRGGVFWDGIKTAGSFFIRSALRVAGVQLPGKWGIL